MAQYDPIQPYVSEQYTMEMKAFSKPRVAPAKYVPMKHDSQDYLRHTLLPDQQPHQYLNTPQSKYIHEPWNLQRTRQTMLQLIFGDVTAITVWLGALAYACMLWYINGRPVNSIHFDVHSFVDTTQLVSTLFTIIFAATTGRSLKNLTLWCLEQGNTIAVLDRLIGSTTVGGTLVTNSVAGWPTSGTMYLMVIGLVALWSASPLGSQALLRITTFADFNVESQVERSYLNVSRWEALPGSGSDGDVSLIAPNNLLNSVLISPFSNKLLPQDFWGNVRIPRYEVLDESERDTDGWINVTSLDYLEYSSLLGIPMGKMGTSMGSFSVASIETWYWTLDCDPWKSYDQESSDPVMSQNWSAVYDYNFTSRTYKYSPAVTIYTDLETVYNRTRDICGTPQNGTEVQYCAGLPPRELAIQLQYGEARSKCRLGTSYVESEIRCDAAACRVQRMRRPKNTNLPPESWTIFDVIWQTTISYMPFGRFALNLVDAIPSRVSGSGGANVLLGYMSIPHNPFSVFDLTPDNCRCYDNVTNANMTQTLAQVLNTYWIANLGARLVTGDYGDNFETFNATKAGGYDISSGALNSSALDKTMATIYTREERVFCNMAWLIVLTLAILVALAMSVMGLITVLLSRGPRLGFNITTMTRDNPYTSLPETHSGLDDDKRSKLAADILVKLGDVRPGHAIGHVALGSVDGAIHVQTLNRERLYD